MAGKVTIYDFVTWIKEQIEPAELSALCTEHGLIDDSNEAIIQELAKNTVFVKEIGELLGSHVQYNQKQAARAIGGVRFANEGLTIDDWKRIQKATGLKETTTETTKSTFDWNALVATILGTAGSVATSIWGKEQTVNQQPQPQTGSNIAMYIIIGVVVVAVIAILFLSISKK